MCATVAVSLAACGSKKAGESAENTEITADAQSDTDVMTQYDASDYVTLGDYSGIEVTLDEDYTVTDADIKEFLEQSVLAYYPYYIDLDKDTVEEGDFVNIDYVGTLDGEAFEGGTAEGSVLEIGSNTFIDGFEEGLIGTTVGETVDLNLTFPEDYHSDALAGQDVVFTVTVNKIVEEKPVSYEDIDDAYIAYVKEQNSSLDYDSAQDMIDDTRTYLESEKGSEKSAAIRNAVLNQITEICKVNAYPEGLIEYRTEEILAQYENYYCDDETTLEDYVTNNLNETYEDFLSEIDEQVKADVDTQLILEAIAAKEGMTFDEDAFQTYVENMLSNYGYSSESMLYLSYGATEQSGKAYLKKIYLCNQALDFLCDKAKVTNDPDTEGQE